MHAELMSKTDNTVRTIEVMISLTGAETRTLHSRDYLPDTLYVTYTKIGEWPWTLEEVELKGRRLGKDGAPTKLGVSEPLILREGQVIVDEGSYAATPELAALVTEHMPKDRLTMPWFKVSSEQLEQLIEKAFAAGFNSRSFYLDWPDHAQAFIDWCDLESERMRIRPGTVPVHGWIEGR